MMLKPKYRLDREERELLASVEKGEWHSKKTTKAERERFIRTARNTLRKNMRVNIRISRADLEGLQTKAIQEGVPYQTLITSILHKFVTGRLTQGFR